MLSDFEHWLAKARAEGRVTETRVNQAALASPRFVNETCPLDRNTSEAQFQQAVVDLAHQCGAKVGSFRKVRVQREDGATYYETPVGADGKGWPDLFICIEGMKPIAAELKVKRNVPTEEQWAWIHLMRSCGLDARVWYPSDWSDIVQAFTHPVPVDPKELHRLADDGCPHAGD